MTKNLKSKFKFFIQCLPILEPIVLKEIEQLGLKAHPSKMGGVILTGNLLDLYKLNIWLRTANRILVRLLSFYATSFSDIIDKVSRYPWEIYLNKTDKIIIKTSSKKSRLYHTKAISERIAIALEKHLGHKVVLINSNERDNSTQTIFVRIVKDKCTISIDSSGAHLHERGYHIKKTKAPLRETIAAAMIYLSNWDPKKILWDPFCGSGTILIEASLIALNIAPGAHRKFAFMDWKNFDQELFDFIEKKKTPLTDKPKILGSDISATSIDCSIYNAQKAGVRDIITFEQKDFFTTSKHDHNKGGFIITNPPYGKRIGTNLSIDFYKKIKNKIQQEFANWEVTLICPANIANILCPPFKIKTTLYNGGIPVPLLNKKAIY